MKKIIKCDIENSIEELTADTPLSLVECIKYSKGPNAPGKNWAPKVSETPVVKSVLFTDGNVINTVEGTGTGANRVGYYYADYTVGNIMPDSAKAKVNFIEE